jgi:hypothetical protein
MTFTLDLASILARSGAIFERCAEAIRSANVGACAEAELGVNVGACAEAELGVNLGACAKAKLAVTSRTAILSRFLMFVSVSLFRILS